MFRVRFTKSQILRLKYLALQQMEYAGFDDERPVFDAWNEILEALEQAEPESWLDTASEESQGSDEPKQ